MIAPPIARAFWLVLLAAAAGSAAPPEGEDLTEKTAQDAAALRALQQTGQVFFREDFESDDWHKRFFDHRGLKDGRLTLTSEAARVCAGRKSLQCKLPPGKEAVACASLWFPAGHEKVHLRWYTRFGEDFDQGNLMHFVGLAGVAGTNRYAGMGQAGIRPTGYDRFTTGFEPWRSWGKFQAPGAMNFYSYFPGMKGDRQMKGKYWGNQFMPQNAAVPRRGKWHCFEVMLKANEVGQKNGEQAAWIDGRLYAHFAGIEWRKSADVRIKRVYLGVYIHDNPKENVVLFDEMALSTGYIGPRQGDASGRSSARP